MHSKAGFYKQKIQNRHLLCSTSSWSGALWESSGCLTYSSHTHGTSVLSQWMLEATNALQHSIDSADLARIGLNLATDWVCKNVFQTGEDKTGFSFSAYLQSCLDSYVQEKKITSQFHCLTMKFILLLMWQQILFTALKQFTIKN